jgi:hypothetical protein
MSKTPKKGTPTYWRKKCVTLAKLIARKRDGDRCRYCGRSKEQGYSIHGSHVLPEGTYVSMSADPDNIIALCSQHHMSGANPRMGTKEPSWHSHPLLFGEWFRTTYPEHAKMLQERSRILQVVDWEKRYQELKAVK